MNKAGTLIISLDFELAWGIRDMANFETSKKNLEGVQSAIPKLLDVFDRYDIKATFAVVGFLFNQNKQELIQNIPNITPKYLDKNLSPYTNYIANLPNTPKDTLHFCPSLIQKIRDTYKHEISSHTYSHYYCLEEGQSPEEFEADLVLNKRAGLHNGFTIESIVFPRNQYSDSYLELCKKHGIKSYRGNEKSWFNKPTAFSKLSIFTRGIRLLDSYINLSGFNSYPLKELYGQTPYNIRASRFLRPHSPMLSLFDKLKLKRICKEMTHAAISGEIYHLWWHPHNFGANQEKNFIFLESILEHYKKLNKTHQFSNATMSSISNEIELNEFN